MPTNSRLVSRLAEAEAAMADTEKAKAAEVVKLEAARKVHMEFHINTKRLWPNVVVQERKRIKKQRQRREKQERKHDALGTGTDRQIDAPSTKRRKCAERSLSFSGGETKKKKKSRRR
jgi:hypothetical protein